MKLLLNNFLFFLLISISGTHLYSADSTIVVSGFDVEVLESSNRELPETESATCPLFTNYGKLQDDLKNVEWFEEAITNSTATRRSSLFSSWDIFTKSDSRYARYLDTEEAEDAIFDLAIDLRESSRLRAFLDTAPNSGVDIEDFKKRVRAYEALIEYPDFRANPDILRSYIHIPRVNPGNVNYLEMRISDLTPTHPVPRPGAEFTIPELKQMILSNGFRIYPNGERTIKVVQLPDGTNLLYDGNHRLQAMRELDQTIVPVKYYTLEDANDLAGADNIAMFAEVSRLTGFYNGPPVPHPDPDFIQVIAVNFLNRIFGDSWR